jgi:membrane-associated protein
VLVARFVPVVRTFTPVLAGVGKMSRRTFLSYNVVGAFIWVVGVTMAGFLLGSVIGTSIDRYLLPVVLLVVLISLIPPLLEWRTTRKQPPTP